jgi:putative addiction module CopG family antidote
MQITVVAEDEAMISDRVNSGAYRSPTELVQEALRLLRERDARMERLRGDIAIGIEQADRGALVPLNTEATIASGRRLLAPQQTSA